MTREAGRYFLVTTKHFRLRLSQSKTFIWNWSPKKVMIFDLCLHKWSYLLLWNARHVFLQRTTSIIKIVKLTDHTCASNDLTNFECEAHYDRKRKLYKMLRISHKKLVKTLWVKVIFCLPICSYLLCWDAWHVPFATHTLNYKTPHSHRIKATNSHANELNTHTVQNLMLIRFKSRKEFTLKSSDIPKRLRKKKSFDVFLIAVAFSEYINLLNSF